MRAGGISADEAVPDTFYPDGSQGINDQYVKNLSLRLTYQVTQKNKLTGYVDRVSKYVGHDMQAGYDPATASRVWEPSKLYMQGQVKLTSTLSSRALLEVGYAQYQAYRHTTYQPGVEEPYGSAEWFSSVTHRDTSKGTVFEAAPGGNYYLMPARRFVSAIASYVTGSHNLKVGMQDTFGFLEQGTTLNGALHQVYQNGAPVQVSIYNTPERDRYTMKGQWGVFGQDSWKFQRLTLNAGLRWDYFSSEIASQESGEGRFVPLRKYGPRGHAGLEDVFTAVGRDLRSVRKRQDGSQVQREQVPAWRHRRCGGRLQPDAPPVVNRRLARPERRRHRGGSTRLHVRYCRLRDQLRPVAGQLRDNPRRLPGRLRAGVHPVRHRPGQSRHGARLRVGVERRRPARTPAPRFGVGQLVLYQVLQPEDADQHAAHFRRLHTGPDRKPSRRQRGDDVQRQHRKGQRGAEPELQRPGRQALEPGFRVRFQREGSRRRQRVRRLRDRPDLERAVRVHRRSEPPPLLRRHKERHSRGSTSSKWQGRCP
jgi:hypothetical protein